MSAKALTRTGNGLPAVFDDFFKPWNGWFGNGGSLWNRMLTVPAVNITEKEENKEETDKKFNRREYSYSSFSRSFTLPEEVNKEKIEAKYEEGVLKLMLPRKEEAKKPAAKQIALK
jgi:HSP20 family protein